MGFLCFAPPTYGYPIVFQFKVNSSVYQSIQQSNISHLSDRQNLAEMYHATDFNHSRISTRKSAEKRKLPRFSSSPVEVQTSNRFNLKKAAHKQMPGDLDGLKQLYKVGQNSSRVM